jgi:hypothetical protein
VFYVDNTVQNIHNRLVRVKRAGRDGRFQECNSFELHYESADNLNKVLVLKAKINLSHVFVQLVIAIRIN